MPMIWLYLYIAGAFLDAVIIHGCAQNPNIHKTWPLQAVMGAYRAWFGDKNV